MNSCPGAFGQAVMAGRGAGSVAPLASSWRRKAVKVSGTWWGGMGRASGVYRVDCHTACTSHTALATPACTPVPLALVVALALALMAATVVCSSGAGMSSHTSALACSCCMQAVSVVTGSACHTHSGVPRVCRACASAATPSATNWARCGPWRAKPQRVRAVVCAGSITTTGSSQVRRSRASCTAWVSAGLSCRRKSCRNQNTTPPAGQWVGQPVDPLAGAGVATAAGSGAGWEEVSGFIFWQPQALAPGCL